MNLLQLSESLNDDEPEWPSLLHTGLDDQSLTKLTIDLLPPHGLAEISKLITDLNEIVYQRDEILIKLCKTVIRTFNPTSRADYLWYLQFTFTVLLLKDLPVPLYALQGDLLTNCFDPITSCWDQNPIKMDYFASHLYDLLENDKNLIFVINQIESRSIFGYYLSLFMIWKSIYRCVDEEKSIFTLYPPSNLIDVTQKISLKKLDTDFDTVLNFVLLHSKIASLIFHFKCRSPANKCFQKFFVYDVSLIKVLKDFLENTLTEAESMWRRHNENLNYLLLIECLQIDISEFDTLYKRLQK